MFTRKRLGRGVDYLITFMAAAFLSFPVLLLVLSSFKLERDIFSRAPTFLFRPQFDNYRVVFENNDFVNGLQMSLLVTVGAVLLTLLASLPAAYAYSRTGLVGVKRTAFGLIAVRMFPPIIIAIPLYPILLRLNLFDTPWVLILVHAAFQISITTLLLKVFIDAVPKELDEASMIDGCNRAQSFFLVVFPLLAPGLFAASIFVALAAWNDYLFAFLFTNFEARTLPIVISELLQQIEQGQIGWGEVFAVCTVQMVPIIAFIWATQKRLLSSFTLGAVKG